MLIRILSGWTLTRVLYFLFGIVFIIHSFTEQQWVSLIPGVYFSAMALFAFGCAGGNCRIDESKYDSESANSETKSDLI